MVPRPGRGGTAPGTLFPSSRPSRVVAPRGRCAACAFCPPMHRVCRWLNANASVHVRVPTNTMRIGAARHVAWTNSRGSGAPTASRWSGAPGGGGARRIFSARDSRRLCASRYASATRVCYARLLRASATRVCYARPELPKPPAPRSLAVKFSTTSKSTWTMGTNTICAMRSPGLTVNGALPRFHTDTISGP